MQQEFATRRRQALETARMLHAEETAWLVYELPPQPFDRRSSSCLVFESDATLRLVRRFPQHWRELADEELFAVSQGV